MAISQKNMPADNCLFDTERLKLRNIFETALVHYLHRIAMNVIFHFSQWTTISCHSNQRSGSLCIENSTTNEH